MDTSESNVETKQTKLATVYSVEKCSRESNACAQENIYYVQEYEIIVPTFFYN